MHNTQHREYFKPFKTNIYKYKAVAIEGIQTAISMDIYMSNEQRKIVEYHIIHIGHTITDKKLEAFRSGGIPLNINKVRLTGKVIWEAKLRKSFEIAVDLPSLQDRDEATPHFMEAIITCPICSNSTTTNNIIKNRDLDSISKCTKCRRNIKANDWKCSCNIPWHTCQSHKYSTISSNNTKNVTHRTLLGTKRAIGPLTHEELINIDNKRIKRTTPAFYPLAPSLLSAKLRDKFAHIL